MEKCYNYNNTVEPPNKGHFGSMAFVLYWEAVLWWEVRTTTESTRVMPIGAIYSQCPLYGGCPLVEGSFIGGSTVLVYMYFTYYAWVQL